MSNLEPLEKQKMVDELLQQPVLARLATTNPRTMQPHVVPVWFLWDGNALFISSFTSTRKVKDLKRNPLCAVIIEPVPAASQLQAVLFEGKAELITQPRNFVEEKALSIYTLYMGAEGVKEPEPQSWIYDPENLIIRLTPQKIYTW
jgi:general stress protein 26